MTSFRKDRTRGSGPTSPAAVPDPPDGKRHRTVKLREQFDSVPEKIPLIERIVSPLSIQIPHRVAVDRANPAPTVHIRFGTRPGFFLNAS